MGQGFSLFNNDDINLNAYKTENFSSTIPYERKLYADANTLVNRLGHSRTQFSMWDDLTPNYKMHQKSAEIENDNNFSDTSPFITSDVYKHIADEQQGGNLDNSTSSTSASDSSTDSSSNDKKKKKTKKESKKDKKKKQKKSPIEEDSDSDSSDKSSDEMDDDDDDDEDVHSGMSSNVLSYSDDSNNTYESSSAHTEDINSNINSNITTVSAKYYRNHSAMSDSINTSDINIISVEN